MRFFAIGLGMLVLALPVPAPVLAADDDALWSSAFAPPGAARDVWAFAELDGALIAGDERWTGSRWEKLGAGLNGQVFALTIDTRGRLIARPVDAMLPVGEHQAEWDGRDRAGLEAPSGSYVARLETANGTRTRKVQLVR